MGRLSGLIMAVAAAALLTGCTGGGTDALSLDTSGGDSSTPGSTIDGTIVLSMAFSDYADVPPAATTQEIATVHNPEPMTLALWGLGLAGAALLRRKKK